MPEITPMMQQYLDIKAQNPDSILFEGFPHIGGVLFLGNGVLEGGEAVEIGELLGFALNTPPHRGASCTFACK